MEIDTLLPSPQNQESVGSLRTNEQKSEANQSSMSTTNNDAADDEEDICRICRTSGDEGSPLFYPCACSGSIKYVHQDCLLQWLNHSHARQCEVCKHPFAFSAVYAENAPARLPLRELIVGMFVKAGRGTRFFARLVLVLSVWLLFIPFTTFWIWRLTFVRSVAEAQRLFASRLTPSLLLTDSLNGFLLSAGIVFIFLGATSLREYFWHMRELVGQEVLAEENAGERQIALLPARRQGQAVPGARRVRPVDGQAVQVQLVAGGNAEAGMGDGLAAGARQLIRRNAENVAAHLEIQAARLEAHVEQMFDAAEDADGGEDVPFDELVGMQGPVFHLIENAITVLASNAIFLALVALVPFTLGRVVLSIASRVMVATGSASFIDASSLSNVTNSRESGIKSTVHFTNLSASTPMELVIDTEIFSSRNLLSSNGLQLVHQAASAKGVQNTIDAMTEAMVAVLKLSDVATVAVGYGVIIVASCLYAGLIILARYGRGQALTVGRIRGVASMAEAAPSFARQVVGGIKYMATLAKVAFLLVIELGVFPLLCGWWLDICTLGMLDVSLSQRVTFFWASPLTSSLLHWLVGIVYMLQISGFVSLLREVLRPGVLYFLRDPSDPNYNPFRDLIDDSLYKHARRVLLSVVVYGSLIVMLVFLPVQLAIFTSPSTFPLDIRVSDPFTELPADMLLFHICIPFALEHFRPRATIKGILFSWFSSVGWALGLSEYLLPPSENSNRAEERGPRPQNVEHAVAPNHERVPLVVQRSNEEDTPKSSGAGLAVEGDFDRRSEAIEWYMFAVRIVVLLVGAMMTLFVTNFAMVLLPISLGRAIFASLSKLPITRGAKCNDLYAFNIGCYVIWAVGAAIKYAVDYLRTHNLRVLMMQVLKWSAIMVKSACLLFFWIVVIPVLVGLLFELLVIVPLRVPVDESPVFLLYQDWALGLVFLKIWTRLVMLGQLTPLADESWRIKFEQVRSDGFSRLRGLWVFQEIVAPILIKLLTALCVPYVVARGLFPPLGFSLTANSAVYRFAWLVCLALIIVWYGIKRMHRCVSDLHNLIRDDRYLIGRRLHNYGERPGSSTAQNSASLLASSPTGGSSSSEQSGVEQEITSLTADATGESSKSAGDPTDPNIEQKEDSRCRVLSSEGLNGTRLAVSGGSIKLHSVGGSCL
ncbi:hypothetical protein O6H91_Y272000 [Diphasiastrum complanatum]|nr:hypothetical protein O6H91_Y272000 [Diphasiastrum complanatum]KAJ7294227.1 hypothetical protein O6H91_Y272000 [Diphasiastrum complanatum]KAJ7294228.1 hypothetical protein O6H91_Y272000 [Diphasiastrum complanatum]KAJ7294229.1 hypothetical protein O6H91_Y272000 [Diphasiastrum complanatum]